MKTPLLAKIALAVLAVGVLSLGALPNLLLVPISTALKAAGF